MSTKYFCDICKKEDKRQDLVRVGWRKEYCVKCWADKKNWVKIHRLEKTTRFAV